MKREFPDWPILCAGGVVVRNDSVLLIRRINPPQQGEWTLPGGMVETGEKVRAALRREVREETGLRVAPLDLLSVFERIVRENGRVRYHYVVLDYICRATGGALKAASDVSDAQWVQKQELGRYRLRRPARQVIDKALAMGSVELK